jgi:hypothetical protein
MRSLRGVIGAVILLLGVVLALLAGALLGKGASEILHLGLGVSFVLFALAVFDFRLPDWVKWPATVGIGLLAAIFLLQCSADVAQYEPLSNLAYRVLGQWPEKLLAFVFLAWCLAVLLLDSRGATRLLGFVALAVVLGIEVYGDVLVHSGGAMDGRLKFLYLPLFVWLLLESRKPASA